ncbi:MAG TPA: hypothetical protein VGF95_02470 [Solirubrobacteraceae bacterium]
MLPFWVSIALLSALQGTIVALPGAQARRLLERLRMPGSQSPLSKLSSRWWALIPPASVALFVLIGGLAASASATALTYFALVGVPFAAALALGWLIHGARPLAALAVLPLFALAWADRTGLPGQAAAVLLSAISCAGLGALIAAVTPPRWLAAGIVAMAVVDVTLVSSELLQHPNNVLNATRPAAGLPQLQAALFGSAAMGYGDLFVAGVLGGLLAVTLGPLRQRYAALLAILLALAFDLLFYVVNELPATVPMAMTLLLLALVRHLRARRAAAETSLAPARSRVTEGGPA